MRLCTTYYIYNNIDKMGVSFLRSFGHIYKKL